MIRDDCGVGGDDQIYRNDGVDFNDDNNDGYDNGKDDDDYIFLTEGQRACLSLDWRRFQHKCCKLPHLK